MKLLFIDEKMPPEALDKLEEYGEPVKFNTEGLTYASVSGHPDIFISQVGDELVVAPNIPGKYKKILSANNISFSEGELPVGDKYPNSARYNILATEKFLFHNFRYTDSSITDRVGERDLIHVNQGYCRCNLIAAGNDHFITSDRGIYKVLNYLEEINVLLVSPDGIMLEGHNHGFIGGTVGVDEGKIFFCGSLDHYEDGEKIREFLNPLEVKIIELYDGPLFDGGGIMFFDS
jgi:hypothetical protein